MGYFRLEEEEKLFLFSLRARRKGMPFVAVPEGAEFWLKWKDIYDADFHLNTKYFFP